ncbi:MAG: flagellar biosynthesis anti-sigma factor FlgM [Actinobacteria bacterium]|nr:flagellar biosynthesis anti-sigma factor FlgM [Actinomycetota bacterium]
MQLSDREIQNTLDLLKQKKSEVSDEAITFSADEIEGIYKLVENINIPPETRRDKVEKVKKAIESSSYNVTDDDIAKKLIGRIISDKLR